MHVRKNALSLHVTVLVGLVGSVTVACSGAAEETGSSGAALGQSATPIEGLAGKCLDDSGNGTADGNKIQLWTCNGTSAQAWAYVGGAFVGPGGKCLDVRGGNTENGTPVQLYTCNGTAAQRWTIADGRILGIGGKCLDVTGFGTDDGTQIEIWDCNGGENQKWELTTTATPAPPPPKDPGAGTGKVARLANDFLESIAVNAHIGQGIDAPDAAANALAYAGFRNLRDVADAATLTNVARKGGVKIDYLMYAQDRPIAEQLVIPEQLAAAGVLLSIEGPNEPNNFSVTYGGKTSDFGGSFLPVASFQRDLYAAVKANAQLAGIPVFHTSEAGGSEPDNVGLQWLTIPDGAGTTLPAGTRYADFANTHNYICGHQSRLVDNLAWNAADPTLDDDWDGLYVEYGRTWHGGFPGYTRDQLHTLPRVSTETGWVTQGSGAIPEETQGRLFLNLYLSAFARSWAHTFVYMLHDDPGQGYWGFFRTGWDPKPSGTYLHNLTTILADRGTRAPGTLDYAIANAPSTVHDLLLQKSNGTFELVVWNERPAGGEDTVTVTFGAAQDVTLYDPTRGTAPTDTRPGATSVSVTVSDHPVILEL